MAVTTRTHLTLSAIARTCLASHGVAHAGGITLYEIASPDLGLASAGYASRADSASTVFKNPAGMSRLQEPQFLAWTP